MKGIRYLFSLLIVIGLFSSCSKSKDEVLSPEIVGKWMSTSVYTQDNGQFNWMATSNFREFITFNPDSRFSIFTDVPGGNGTYIYNNEQRSISLHFEGGTGGNSRVENRAVENISGDKLVVAFFNPQGELVNKIEYQRIN
ncbi:hypothetical protein LZZ85_23420 [Terrimonas sp. NA20]|uniref:Lipocalin-like domain-containing protein n=1 Tax=Terrimonas ginsenosidimutans TaxID=2908004 RepID=A0ABS9KY78_9BACT|nr:hypothetical protein [Terrimonas ginsenosidimutans]MCG2617266.1 hypothetical protein [Terrimonas ginsenosidimutans]